MLFNKILVIENDKEIIDLCKGAFNIEGYSVKYVPTREEAIEIAHSERPDLAIIGTILPEEKRDSFFLSLKERNPELLGVVILSHYSDSNVMMGMKQCFNGFIKWPFDAYELNRVVENTLNAASLLGENALLKTLMPLYKLGEKFIQSHTIKEVLDGLVDAVAKQTGATRISAMLYDEKGGRYLRVVSSIGIDGEIVPKIQKKFGEKIAGWVFEKGEPVILNGGPKDNPEFASFLRHKSIVAAISFPFKARDKTLGVLNVSKVGEGCPFSDVDIEMLSVICGQAVMAIENVKAMDERTEKIKTRAIFEQYVAPEVAELLISREENLLDLGEVKNIAVVFADMRKFTSLVSHVPLKALRAFLNGFFGLFADITFSFKGTLDKFLGDAALAIFGAPLSHDDPVNAAVMASIEIQKGFHAIQHKWAAGDKYFEQAGLGVGISYGEVFLGNVGSEKRLDYTVIGTAVNIAQRLASEASSGQILITETVKTFLRPEFLINRELNLLLRGFDESMPIYSVYVGEAY